MTFASARTAAIFARFVIFLVPLQSAGAQSSPSVRLESAFP